MRWRFLECLQEGVGGCAGDLMRLVDDVELGLELRRCVVHAVSQVADIVDAAVAGRVDLDHVGCRTGINRHAGGALVARALVRIGIEAIDGLGHDPRGGRLTGAAWSAEKVRRSNAIRANRIPECADNVFLTDQFVGIERLRAILPVERKRSGRRRGGLVLNLFLPGWAHEIGTFIWSG